MKIRSRSSIPWARASSISARRVGQSWACSSPPRQRSAAADEHGLARAADADREVVVRAAHGGRDRGEHVAVLDQLDARAGRADLLDQVVVARAVEDDRRHVVDHAAVRVGDRADVLGDRRRSEMRPRARGPTAILRMYMSGRDGIEPRGPTAIIESALLPPRAVTRAALERIEREVDLVAAEADLASRPRAGRRLRARR